jgi:hypothetical protein
MDHGHQICQWWEIGNASAALSTRSVLIANGKPACGTTTVYLIRQRKLEEESYEYLV